MNNSIQTYAKVLHFVDKSKDINTIRKILDGIEHSTMPENCLYYNDIEALRQLAITAIENCEDSSTLYDLYDKYINVPYQQTYSTY